MRARACQFNTSTMAYYRNADTVGACAKRFMPTGAMR